MKTTRAVRPPTDPRRLRMLRQVGTDAPSKVQLFRRLYEPGGRVPPRHAIKCQCLQCCWMDRLAIRACTDTACPLWSFRPYRDGGPAGDGQMPLRTVPLSGVERGSEATTRKSPHIENAIGDSHPLLRAEIDPRKSLQEGPRP